MTTSRFVTSVLIVLSAVALSLSALSVTSCKPKGAEVPVTGITVSQPALSITEGETATISYTVEPSDASVKGVAFSSSAPGVATVDENGVVTAVSPGTATITVTTKDGGFTASITVTVKAKGGSGPGTDTSVKVTGITLDKSELSIGVGTYSVLVATVEPSNAADKTVEWKSSKPAVAVVDDEGKVSGIIPGSATITATTRDGGFKATCEVLVVSQHPLDDMLGDYTIGGNILDDAPGYKNKEWEMEMRAYDGDHTRVWLDCIVPICSQKYYQSYFTHGLISAYGIVSSDKKTITIPVPQETSAWLSDLFAKYKDDDHYWVYKWDDAAGKFIATPGNIVFTKQADGTYKAADFDFFGVAPYGETDGLFYYFCNVWGCYFKKK